MTPFLSLLLPIVVSAVAVFVLTLVVHMTPWHKGDHVKLPDEDGVMQALRPFRIPPNDYAVPHPGSGEYMKSAEYDARREGGPVMFLTVLPSGPWNVGRMAGTWFLFTLMVSAGVAWVVAAIIAPGGDRRAVFRHVAAMTFLIHAMGPVPMSVWYGRKWATTFRNVGDALVSALLTGWIFSVMWPG